MDGFDRCGNALGGVFPDEAVLLHVLGVIVDWVLLRVLDVGPNFTYGFVVTYMRWVSFSEGAIRRGSGRLASFL